MLLGKSGEASEEVHDHQMHGYIFQCEVPHSFFNLLKVVSNSLDGVMAVRINLRG